jgi:ribosomal protein S18 acetylase RimI-like enzyme
MEPDHLTVEEHPTPADVEFLSDRLHEHNVSQTGVAFGGELAIYVRDDAGQIAAGIYGWTWADWLEIRYLWVREDRRRKGLGRTLLLAAEREAIARGSRYVVLDSYSFQAPGFYQKLGYQVFGKLTDFPGPHQRYYLWKRL